MFAISCIILILILIILLHEKYKPVLILAIMIMTVLLWKGIWDLGDWVDEELGNSNKPFKKGMLSLSIGLIIAYVTSGNIKNMLTKLQSRFERFENSR